MICLGLRRITLPFYIEKTSEKFIQVGTPGVKMRIGRPYPQRIVKGDQMGRFLVITVKRVASGSTLLLLKFIACAYSLLRAKHVSHFSFRSLI